MIGNIIIVKKFKIGENRKLILFKIKRLSFNNKVIKNIVMVLLFKNYLKN